MPFGPFKNDDGGVQLNPFKVAANVFDGIGDGAGSVTNAVTGGVKSVVDTGIDGAKYIGTGGPIGEAFRNMRDENENMRSSIEDMREELDNPNASELLKDVDFQDSLKELVEKNHGDPEALVGKLGEEVAEPQSYTVEQGDTLSGIAEEKEIPLEDLLERNPELGDGSLINPGQEITLGEDAAAELDPAAKFTAAPSAADHLAAEAEKGNNSREVTEPAVSLEV